jgi:hypothetical protein
LRAVDILTTSASTAALNVRGIRAARDGEWWHPLTVRNLLARA